MPSIEANGEQIYFLDEGDGPVVFFIHSLGTNSYLFREQILEMKKKKMAVMDQGGTEKVYISCKRITILRVVEGYK